MSEPSTSNRVIDLTSDSDDISVRRVSAEGTPSPSAFARSQPLSTQEIPIGAEPLSVLKPLPALKPHPEPVLREAPPNSPAIYDENHPNLIPRKSLEIHFYLRDRSRVSWSV